MSALRITKIQNHLLQTPPNISITTRKGHPKAENQDYCKFKDDVLCLCDGHGSEGELLSQFVCESILTGILPNDIHEKLERQPVALYSGTTCVWAVNNQDTITVFNVGDSRCVVLNHAGDILLETRDHKPDDAEELARIASYGGVVTFSGVARVGGLAVSRAFGDFAVAKFGVVSNPDEYELSKKNVKLLIFGSDGVFDILSSKEVAEYVWTHLDDLKTCTESLVTFCEEQWKIDTAGRYIDDITLAIWVL